MGNFNDFLVTKTLDQLAEKCVREKIPIVEFVDWYFTEGQYLEGSFVGDTAMGALAGGGLGSYLGPWGTLAGAGVGGLVGAGKHLYNRFAGGRTPYEATKQQALDALQKFAAASPGHAKVIGGIVNYLSKITPNPMNSPQSSVRNRAAASQPSAPKPLSLDDLFRQGLASRDDLKKIAALPPEERAKEMQRLQALHQSRQGYAP